MLLDRTESFADQRDLRRLITQLAADLIEPRLCQCQGFGVAVKCDQPALWPEPPRDFRRVACKPERAVGNRAAGLHPEEFQSLCQKNWHMPYVRVRHALPPEGLNT